MRTLRIGLCQINTTVGDIEEIQKRFSITSQRERRWVQDLLAFPEMAVTGYPPEDLLFMPKFHRGQFKGHRQDCRATSSITALVALLTRMKTLLTQPLSSTMENESKLTPKTFLPITGSLMRTDIFSGKGKFCLYSQVNTDWTEHL